MKQTKKITLIAVVTAAILILPFLLPNAYIIPVSYTHLTLPTNSLV